MADQSKEITSDDIDELVKNAALKETPKESKDDSNYNPDPEFSIEYYRFDFELKRLRQELEEDKDKHDLRKNYANKIFWLVCWWLVFVLVSIYLEGFKFQNFELSDNVLIAFITSTTINVVGLFYVVAKWMYPSLEKSKVPDTGSKDKKQDSK